MNTVIEKVDNAAQYDLKKKFDPETLDSMVEYYTIEDYWHLSVLTYPSVWRKPYKKSEAACDVLESMGIDPELLQERFVPLSVFNLKEKMNLDKYLEDDIAFMNVKKLSSIIPLTDLEIKIMVFASHLSNSQLLNDLAEPLHCPSRRKLSEVMAHILNEDVNDIMNALHEDSQLTCSGLLRKSRYDDFFSEGIKKYFLVNGNLLDIIDLPNISEEQLVDCFYKKSSEPDLSLDDLEYRLEDIIAISDMVSSAKNKPVNILLYGKPGVGKTQTAKVIADLCHKDVVSIPEYVADSYNVSSAHSRVSSLQTASKILKDSNKSIILFDEADDALNGSDESRISRKSGDLKGQLTKLLEDNRVPVIWITNAHRSIHEAVLRRFNYILEVKEPPIKERVKRMKVQLKQAGFELDSKWLRKVAIEKEISAGVFSKGLENVSLCKEKVSNTTCQKMLTTHFNNYLNAIGSRHKIKENTQKQTQKKTVSTMKWDSSFLNTDMDLSVIAKAGKQNLPVRLCLYGPPGTGKTEWAKQLAKSLKKQLIIKQASDMLGMFVGQSEQNIAQAFHEAERKNAILLIDEADSFLWPRESATAVWQISTTNQFLTSLENFNGIFIATTNRLELTDQAVMRRFDFRVKFNFLKPDQVKTMFENLTKLYEVEASQSTLEKLSTKKHFTPGDFAVLARRLPFLKGSVTDHDLLKLLEDETAYKQQQDSSIGFHANLVNKVN